MNVAFQLGRKRAYINGIFSGVFIILGFGSIFLVLWYGGNLVKDQKMTIGDLTSYIMYTITLSVGLMASGGTANSIITALGVAERVFILIFNKKIYKN